MKDTAPEDALGYVVVSLPDRGDWQGFFVMPSYASKGEAMLRNVRDANAHAAAEGGATEVDRALPGLSDADQTAVGTLSAVLADLFTRGLGEPQPSPAQAEAIMAGVGAAAWALRQASGERWLLVTGREVPGRAGLATTVRKFKVETLDEAREAMAAEISRAKDARKIHDNIRTVLGGLKRDGSPP
jgi:AcrR family transcriptional regulator